MKIVALATTLAFLGTLTAAIAAPAFNQAGLATDSSLVQVKSEKKRTTKKRMTNKKGMNNMKGMDHSKMPM